MQLITIFNYPDEPKFNAMCSGWLQQAVRHAGDLAIVVLTARPLNPTLAGVVAGLDRVSVEICERRAIPGLTVPDSKAHNIEFKMWNLSQRAEPYIWVDADAVIFRDLAPLVAASADRPWIGIDHQRDLPLFTAHIEVPFLNGGVQVVGDPDFVTFDGVMAQFDRTGGAPAVPGAEQAALFGYFRNIGYDYSHPDIGPEWNACAGTVDLARAADGAFTAAWADLPGPPAPPNRQPVGISHYWELFKPWLLDCPVFHYYRGRLAGAPDAEYDFAAREAAARERRRAIFDRLNRTLARLAAQARAGRAAQAG